MTLEEMADKISDLIEELHKQPKTRELALAATSLETASHWLVAQAVKKGEQQTNAVEILEWLLARYKERIKSKFDRVKAEATP